MDSPNRSSEVDLVALFKSIGSWLRGIFMGILFGLAGARLVFTKNFKFFTAIVLVGISVIIVQVVTEYNTTFSSSMILKCDYTNTEILKSSINKFNLLCKEKEREGLSSVLGINKEIAKNIVEFDVEQFVSEEDRIETEILKEQLKNVVTDKKALAEKVIQKIELGNRQTFSISIIVKDPNTVERLDSAIVNYFRNNQFISKRIIAHKNLLEAKKEKLQRESRKLDSLKNVIFENFKTMASQSREGSNNVILSDKYLTDPLNVFKEDLSLHDQIREIEQALKLSSDFEVIDGLTVFRTPSNLKLWLRLLIAIGAAIVSGYLFLGLWNFNKYLASLTDKVQA